MKILQKIGAALATSSLMLAMAATSAFAADLSISGNGVGSNNSIRVSSHCQTGVIQSNQTLVATAVYSSANTGDNSASSNTTTGGDVTIDTGAASSTVGVIVEGGGNTASDLPNCCECQTDPSADISGNGADSTNRIRVRNSSSNFVLQANKTAVLTAVKSKANSGRNRTNRNTTSDGGGVGTTTSDATSTVGVSVTTPTNTLNP